MLREKVKEEMVLLSEGSSVKESPEDKKTCVPCVRGSTFTWGTHIFCKIRAGARIFRGVRIFCYTGAMYWESRSMNHLTGQLIVMHTVQWVGQARGY